MFDLHMHTVYSDGENTIKEILKLCEDKGLKYISITDHNTCNQYDDEMINDKTFTGHIIKGVELNAKFKGHGIEILAYNIDTDVLKKWLSKYYSDDKLLKQKKIIIDRFFKACVKHNIVIDKEKALKGENKTKFIGWPIFYEIVSHEENRKILGKYFDSYPIFYREKLANPDSSYFLGETDFVPEFDEVIDIIHKAGGKAFLAHPFEYKFSNTKAFLDDITNTSKLDGIECYHPSANMENIQFLINYANNKKMYISGGSDYHGKKKPDRKIGMFNDIVNIEYIKKWIK